MHSHKSCWNTMKLFYVTIPKKCREIILLGMNYFISKSRSWAGDRFFPVRKQQELGGWGWGGGWGQLGRQIISLSGPKWACSKSCLPEVTPSSGISHFACGRLSALPVERTAVSSWCKHLALGCWRATNFKLETIMPVCWQGNPLHWESPQILSKLWIKYRYLPSCDDVTCFVNLTRIWGMTEAEQCFLLREAGRRSTHPAAEVPDAWKCICMSYLTLGSKITYLVRCSLEGWVH